MNIGSKRNYSTSHVHMMLSTALSMMIDKTECIFFLNTPSSIRSTDEIDRTNSAWIYFEIAISKLVEKKPPNRLLFESEKTFSEADRLIKSFEITHKVDLEHFNHLPVSTLKIWNKVKYKSPKHALDRLYQLSPPPKLSDTLYG
jgi:hypothetical protein